MEVGKLIGLLVELKEELNTVDASKYTQNLAAAPQKTEEKKESIKQSPQPSGA